MNDIVRSCATVSAPRLFSETHPELFSEMPPSLDWQMRPVLVVGIADDPMDHGGEHKSGMSFGEPLVEAIRLAGYQPDQANIHEIGRYPGTYHFPRNLPWKDLPIMTRPVFRHEFHELYPLTHEGRIDRPPFGQVDTSIFDNPAAQAAQTKVVEGVEALVISCNELTDRNLRVATAIFDSVDEDLFPVVVHHSPSGSTIVDRSEALRVRERFKAEERFVFNHVVNFVLLSQRAFLKVAKEDELPARYASHVMPDLRMFGWQVGHPLCLQALYLIRRSGPAVACQGLSLMNVDLEQMPWVIANGMPFIENREGQFVFNWTGTGKYRAWEFPLGRVEDYSGDAPRPYISRSCHWVITLLQRLASNRLIGLDGDRIAITDVGERILDILGPDIEDVDLPLRWQTETGEWGTSDDVKAMDRWSNRAFRSVKRRVSPLPASAVAFESPWKHMSMVANRLAFRGVVVPLTDEIMSDTECAALVATIGAEEATIPERDRRRGLVMTQPDLDGKAEARAVWFGIPLGVFSTADVYQDRIDLFMDMNKFDETLAPILTAIPEKLALKPFIDRVRTVSLIETEAECERYVELPPQMEISDGDDVRDIVMGSVLALKKLEGADMALVGSAGTALASRHLGWEPSTDGLRIYGDCENVATFAYGILVGRINKTTGAMTRSRSIDQGKMQDFVKRMKDDKTKLRAFFEDPDTTVDGQWVISADGTVEPLRPIPPQGGTPAPDPEPKDPEPTAATTGEDIEAASPFSLRESIRNDAYKAEWIAKIDPDGMIEKAQANPMSVLAITGIPESHVGFLPGADAEYEHSRLAKVTRNAKKPRSENEYAQQLRDIVNGGRSALFVAGQSGGVPAIYEANGPVVRPADFNAFEIAARTLLTCELKFAEKELGEFEIITRDGSSPTVAEVVRRDGSILVDGEWRLIRVSPKHVAAMWSRLKYMVQDRKVDMADLLAMDQWRKRKAIVGVTSTDGPASLSDIPGIGRVRERLSTLRRKMDVNGGKVGIVLHGKPGTGKTMIARTLAREVGRHFVLGSFAEWQSSGEGHLGTTLAAMRAAFEEAKANQPSLLFLDEMDSLGKRSSGGGNNSEYMKAVINGFLELVQGFHGRGDVVVVGATNFLGDLDEAITRSGRLGDHVFIDLPDRNEVKQIIDWFAKRAKAESRIDSARFADVLVGCTPADIDSIFEEAVMAASEEGVPLSDTHVEAAVSQKIGANEFQSGFFVLHEAARVVALHRLGQSDHIACVRNRPSISSKSGIVMRSREGERMSSDRVRHLQFLLAGMAMASTSGDADVGGVVEPCIMEARTIARELVGLGLGAGNRVSFTPLSDGAAVDKAMTEWLEWAYAQVLALLDPLRDTVRELADELQKREYLDADDIIRILDGASAEPRALKAA